jgi:leader peptidase (prepilin peptidase)/N-methyltransferase
MLDTKLVYALGTAVGLSWGTALFRVREVLLRRHGLASFSSRDPRYGRFAVVGLSTLCGLVLARVIDQDMGDASLSSALVVLTVNVGLASAMIAAAAIDLEHMILPNELTLGGALVALVTSPWRSLGLRASIAGAVVAFVVSYVPFVLYKRIRGRSGMGLGDAKLTIMAGVWQGAAGALFVVLAAAVQSLTCAALMRLFGARYAVPESVKAELAELRARAAAGDAEAQEALADDPMSADANDANEDMMGMRMPFGPFLALASIELLLARRWIFTSLLRWLAP